MRERTQHEKEFVWGMVYEQCLNGGHTPESARTEATKAVKMLPKHTEQPESAAEWLRRRRRSAA